eukprot:TRINITY_DN2492_c0_g1_i1.p1 TRINITY_DN2492_c0_g1~~TRINITY_DN2492_c0_g1_i1.p1  ORF type:complete len:901 (+),score=230.67 TRINITY_DN2492_c0_g1_i1:66-2768(+)
MSGSDAKYFQNSRKGEIQEFREELRLPSKDKKKDAVKKVIAAMTVGKDVSLLFPDVLNCIQTPDLELKKLVYLYLMNYAKTQPDLAILAVNTFVKDAQDPKPLVRALAIRTMGCIRVDKITEYLCEPLRKSLKDEDAYVRKTAAVCVAKLFDINPTLVEDQGFVDLLRGLLSDPNPMVVANAVSSLTDIAESSGRSDIFELSSSLVNKLLTAINECAEWGQIYILDAISRYTPSEPQESDSICERVSPRLQHSNSAVVLTTVKVILRHLDNIANEDVVRSLCKKMAPPLITLMSSPEPEVQYVALRNIEIIIQKKTNILSHEVKIFFCKYNDPIYVKLEKLEIMIKLASERNIDQVLGELKEYATEVDVEFVRKSVRSIGRCAIKLERAAEKCIQALLDLIQTKVNYVVQEVVIVIKDIFRRYPNQYEGVIATLCENLESLDEPEAKGSMIWIVGEYSDRIDNAAELLDSFLDSFSDEVSTVQLQLLTAVVKLYLSRPQESQELVQKILNLATQETDNPDLRDRGYIYWRLLSTDPNAARAVVRCEKPVITDDTNVIESSLLDDLVQHLSTLASVYHRRPEYFAVGPRAELQKKVEEDEEDDGDGDNGGIAAGKGGVNLLDLDDIPGTAPSNLAASANVSVSGSIAASSGNLLDDLSFLATPSPAAPAPKPKPLVLPADKGDGMAIYAAFARRGGQVSLDFTFENQSAAPLHSFAVQFNKNSYNFTPAGALNVPVVNPGQKVEASLPISLSGQNSGANPPSPIIQIAVKNNVKIYYFQAIAHLNTVFVEDGRQEKQNYLATWRTIPDATERAGVLSGVSLPSADAVQQKLEANNVFVVAQRKNESNMDVLYVSARTATGVVILAEVTFPAGGNQARVAIRTAQPEWLQLAEAAFAEILRA